jgi:hypothetical protein
MTIREYFGKQPGLVALWVAGSTPFVTYATFVLACASCTEIGMGAPRWLLLLLLVPILPPLACVLIGIAALREGRRRHHPPSAAIGGLAVIWGAAQLVWLAASPFGQLAVGALLMACHELIPHRRHYDL